MANFEYQTLATLLTVFYGTDTDFGAINCLIPEHAKVDETFPSLTRAVEYRDNCVFSSFWSVLAEEPLKDSSLPTISKLVNSSHAKDAFRKHVLQTLSLTFKSVSLSQVLSCLDFENEAELNAFMKGRSPTTDGMVETVDVDKVVFCDNAENTLYYYW